MTTESTVVRPSLTDREVRESLAEMTGFGIEHFSITSARPNSWTVRASCGCRISFDQPAGSDRPLVHAKGSNSPSKRFCVLAESAIGAPVPA